MEGFLTDYDTNSQTYTILYDPNDPGLKETTEFGFDLNSTNPVRDMIDLMLLKICVERTLFTVFYVCRVNMFSETMQTWQSMLDHAELLIDLQT